MPRGITNSDTELDRIMQANNHEGLVKEKMYSIQVGDKLFKLSGASLLSDSPSYFTSFFSDPANIGKSLFIDRSPKVFEKIYLHLQGYYITIENEFDFVYLFADAHYFTLPGLKTLLYESDIFTRIGDKSFRISKELITSEGNYPNFFSVSFNALFGEPQAVRAIGSFLRPPQLKPPILSNHSPELFAELLSFLQGRTPSIRDEAHRKDLLVECKYYKFLGLEQQLINHRIQLNPFTQQEEIILNLNDLRKKGILPPSPKDIIGDSILKYSRPYADMGVYRNLIIQINNSECSLYINRKNGISHVEFINNSAKKMGSLFMEASFETQCNEEKGILTAIADFEDCACTINGNEVVSGWIESLVARDKPEELVLFKVLKAQYMIIYRGRKPWLKGILLEAVSDPVSFYKRAGFI